MNTLAELLKETFILVFGIFVLGLILKLFFKHTLLGKIIAVIVVDTILFIRLCFRITRKSGKFTYKTCSKINKYLSKKLKQGSNKNKKSQKKVVNGSNVIDFSSAKQLRHKWIK